MISAAEDRVTSSEALVARIAHVEAFTQRVSRKTEFLFLRLSLDSSCQGWGEATYNALNGQVLVALRILIEGIADKTIEEARAVLGTQPCWKHGRAFRVAVSGLEMAILDAEARQRNVPMCTLMGTQHNDTIRCYANINRGTVDRSPGGWAERAQGALRDGHRAVKIAPFDQLKDGDGLERLRAARGGIDALHAVREVAGDAADIMLDCHWRFDEASAVALLDEIAPSAPKWVEAPILEDFEAIPGLLRIREMANGHGIELSGGEFHSGFRDWLPFLRQHVYDTANPDVRFCGPTGMVEIAATAAKFRIGYAPHNHLGPVMTAASLHAMSVAETAQYLELQHAESDIGSCLEDPSVLEPKNGEVSVPQTSGLGISINIRALESVQLT